MTAVRYRLRGELRRSIGFLVVGGILAGLISGVVVAAAIGARRNATAFSRLVESTDAATVLINPDQGAQSHLTTAAVSRLPMVVDAGRLDGLLVVLDGPDGRPDLSSNGEVLGLHDEHALRTVERPKIEAGNLPAADDRVGVFVNRTLADRRHLRVGSVLRLHPAVIGPKGPRFTAAVRARVRGIGRFPSDIVAANGQDPTRVLPSQAFDRAHRNSTIYLGYYVRLRHGTDDVAALRIPIDKKFPSEGFEYQTIGQIRSTVQRASSPSTVSLALFAAVLGATALVGASQAAVRHVRAGARELPALRAMGMDRNQLTAGALAVVATFATVAGLVAIPVAVLLSGRFPIGPGRFAEPHPGLAVHVLGLLAGTVAVTVGIVAASAPGVVRVVRRALDPQPVARGGSRIADLLSAGGLGPAPGLGVRAALDPGSPTAPVPTRSMLAGATLGLTVLVGALVFGANLQRLLDSPARYGWAWNATVTISLDPTDATTGLAARTLEQGLRDAPWVRRATR